MTMPALAQPMNLAAGAGISATPQSVADRVDMLNQNGHAWMPPDMQTSLATSDTPHSEMLSIADGIKSTLATAWNGFTEATDDPILHKQPSAALALSRYLHASLGPLPVRQDDLHVIQANLQKHGFGQGLPLDGVWGPEWNGAYNDWRNDVTTRQLAGDKPGSVSTAHAGHSIWDALLPSHAINAIVGFAKGIPGDVRSLAADMVGGASFIAHGPFQSTHQAEHNIEGPQVAVENAFGNNITAQQIHDQGIGRELNDVATLLMIVPVAGEASAAAKTAKGAWEGGVTMTAAQRSTGVIARSFGGGLSREQLGKGALDVAERNALRRGPLNSRVFTNIPLLRQVGPTVGRLYDADGLYYKTRTLLAAPYALPSVRVAGALGQRAMLQGAALNLGAQAETALGVNGQMADSITSSRAVDTIDLNLQRITGTPYAHPFSRAVDSLGFVLHGPLGSHASSVAVGDRVQAMTDHMSNTLGQVGLHGIFERAVSKATGTKTQIEDLQKQFGSPEYLDRFIAMKTADLGAAHHAQNIAQREGLASGSLDYRDRVGQLADEVWANPDTHHDAIRELLADPVEFENRVAADIVHEASDPKAYARNAIGWMQAGDVLTDGVIRNGLAKYMFGPDGRTIIGNAQDHFDHGFGMDTPVRLMNTTRRDYINQVSTALTSVRRQIDQARTDFGKQVTQAEADHAAAQAAHAANPSDEARTAVRSAAGKVQQARKRQTALEAALQDGNMRKFADLAKKMSGPRKTARQWDAMVKDTARLRMLVDQGTQPGERLSLQGILENGVNPDELYSNINGEARLPSENIGSGDWMRQHLQTPAGSLGLGRLDTKSAQEATADIGRFRTAVSTAQSEEDRAKVVEQMKAYGFREFGMTEHTLGVFDGDPAALADRLDEQAHRLASEAFLTYDAPQELKTHLGSLRELGYRPMLGSHIGHMWDSSLPPMPEIDGAITKRRRVVSALGLAPESVSNRAAGHDARIRILNNMQRVIDEHPKARLPARTTPETVLQVANELLQPELRLPENVAFSLSRRAHRAGIRQLAAEKGIDLEEAGKEYKAGLLRALQLRDIPRREWMRVMTTAAEFPNGARWEGVDKATAALLYRAALKGYADRPNYILGLSGIEDWARAGFSVGNKVAVQFPDAGWVQAAANLPNELIQIRNRARFTLSPFFDFRRVTKQNVKMGIDGVTPVLNPLAHMVDNGTFTKAHTYLTKLLGDPQVQGFDDADRYLHQQSIWGLYNSRHFEAYYAWEKHLQGESDDEIRQGIRRVFDYGSTRQEGRSALERTVNTVFFPFSFEKTLLRNVGAHMLDHPQQALLLTGAISAYDEANKNEAVHKWVNDHLPILRDMEKLNAFAHGISPGELGGINAPLLNLFLPQMWGKEMNKKNLKRMLPIWNDFGQLLADTREQATIGKNAALNTVDYAVSLGKPRSSLDPYRPTITRQAQQVHATKKRAELITALATVLDFNSKTTDLTRKILWPTIPGLPGDVQGQPIDRTSISSLVKIWYPAYDPGSASRYAQEQQAALDTQIGKIAETDPRKAAEYRAFSRLADTIQGHLNRGDYDTPQAAQLMMTMRTIAGDLSTQDPEFYKMFQSHYQYAFGPQTEVKA